MQKQADVSNRQQGIKQQNKTDEMEKSQSQSIYISQTQIKQLQRTINQISFQDIVQGVYNYVKKDLQLNNLQQWQQFMLNNEHNILDNQFEETSNQEEEQYKNKTQQDLQRIQAKYKDVKFEQLNFFQQYLEDSNQQREWNQERIQKHQLIKQEPLQEKNNQENDHLSQTKQIQNEANEKDPSSSVSKSNQIYIGTELITSKIETDMQVEVSCEQHSAQKQMFQNGTEQSNHNLKNQIQPQAQNNQIPSHICQPSADQNLVNLSISNPSIILANSEQGKFDFKDIISLTKGIRCKKTGKICFSAQVKKSNGPNRFEYNQLKQNAPYLILQYLQRVNGIFSCYQ